MATALKKLELLSAKETALHELLTRVPDKTSDEYLSKAKVINKIWKQGVKSLKKKEKEEVDSEPTEHQVALTALELKDKEYSATYKFNTAKIAKTALRALADDWITPEYGQKGGNTWRTHHGGPRGCFLITVDKQTKKATLWVASDNDTDLPDEMEGAEVVDESESDEGDREYLLTELELLIAGAGVSMPNLKAMDGAERSAHAAKCSADRSITAKAVSSLADKMGCSADENTKAKRLEWIMNEYI
jgi:hypothetical protein